MIKNILICSILMLSFSGFSYGGSLQLIEKDDYKKSVSWKGVKTPIPKSGYYFLPTGFTFDAILDGAVFSFNLISPTVAVIDQNVYFEKDLILPRGTRFIGNVSVVHSLDRVNINFHTCVFPDGQEIKMNLLALSMDGSGGVKGKVEKHKDSIAAKIAMKSILTGVSAGAAVTGNAIEGAVAQDLSQDAITTIDTSNVKEIKSIFIEERTPIKLFLNSRVDF